MIWVDAQLSPALAPWIQATFGIPCLALRDVGLRDAMDLQIFQEARTKNAVVMTKDVDFPILQAKLGAPPTIIWLTCGNTSNAKLRELLSSRLPKVLYLLEQGEILVEIH